MKKFFAMLLAAMMLLSCVSAMATGLPDYISTEVDPRDDIVAVETFVNTLTATTNGIVDTFKANDQTSGTVGTELWLQVSAQGQIDVTVPLALVFATNIDGGEATEASNYGITNYSTADLKVTKIEYVKHDDNPMQLEVEIDTDDVDTFEGYLEAGERKFPFCMTKDTVYSTYSDYEYTDNQVFELESAYDGGNTKASNVGKKTEITAYMETSRLSFVTQQKSNKEVKDSTTPDQDTEAMATKGVQLLTVVYTIAVDDNDYNAADANKEINYNGDIPGNPTKSSAAGIGK